MKNTKHGYSINLFLGGFVMTDEFAEGWIEFQEFCGRLMTDRHLTIKDIEEYVKMLKEDGD